jgi:hypothetical protein
MAKDGARCLCFAYTRYWEKTHMPEPKYAGRHDGAGIVVVFARASVDDLQASPLRQTAGASGSGPTGASILKLSTAGFEGEEKVEDRHHVSIPIPRPDRSTAGSAAALVPSED